MPLNNVCNGYIRSFTLRDNVAHKRYGSIYVYKDYRVRRVASIMVVGWLLGGRMGCGCKMLPTYEREGSV